MFFGRRVAPAAAARLTPLIDNKVRELAARLPTHDAAPRLSLGFPGDPGGETAT
jgi:hypothetical protein